MATLLHALVALLIVLAFTLSFQLNACALAEPTCDEALWQHVYHPKRLQVVKRCITVTGKIVKRKAEPDGDVHIQLKLDSQFENLLNERNRRGQNGNLVLEPICVGPVTQADAKAACRNFTNKVHIPAVRTHVSVTGAYVLDTAPKHGWMEIHPVTSITPTP
jgi:hypothetical protein